MAHKQVAFQSAAREKILRGATQLADAVRITLGPKSKSVLIQKSWGAPIVCNDGVTKAKEFDLADPQENLGAHVLGSDNAVFPLELDIPLAGCHLPRCPDHRLHFLAVG